MITKFGTNIYTIIKRTNLFGYNKSHTSNIKPAIQIALTMLSSSKQISPRRFFSISFVPFVPSLQDEHRDAGGRRHRHMRPHRVRLLRSISAPSIPLHPRHRARRRGLPGRPRVRARRRREGLMIRVLCMRLTQLGLPAHCVDDFTAPSASPGDLLIASAEPDVFSNVDVMCGVARASCYSRPGRRESSRSGRWTWWPTYQRRPWPTTRMLMAWRWRKGGRRIGGAEALGSQETADGRVLLRLL